MYYLKKYELYRNIKNMLAAIQKKKNKNKSESMVSILIEAKFNNYIKQKQIIRIYKYIKVIHVKVRV